MSYKHWLSFYPVICQIVSTAQDGHWRASGYLWLALPVLEFIHSPILLMSSQSWCDKIGHFKKVPGNSLVVQWLSLSSESRWPKFDLLISGQGTRSYMPQQKSKVLCATAKTRYVNKCTNTKNKKKKVTVLRRHGHPTSRDTSIHQHSWRVVLGEAFCWCCG